MSYQSNRRSRRSSSEFEGLPLYSSIGIIVAALLTGLLISWFYHSLGWPFLALFVVASVVATLLTNPKNLYIVVISIPILFAVFLVITGWVVNWADLPDYGDPFSTTSILMSVYPLVQHFPVLLVTFLGCAAIAVVRVWLLKRYNKVSAEKEMSDRQRISRENRETRRTSQRAREQTSQVSVQELIDRRNQTVYQPPRRTQRTNRSEQSQAPESRGTTRRPVDRLDNKKPRQDRSPGHRLGDDIYGD
ncbi:DUF6542 domain-containing protein [Corynebacterium lubricantis]|uniref:DUF6542 domain-containing protein n=1 Tax=Corynebacterium lubricantis TaxID=541095 RepID=UPI00037A0AD7|nr:DUF6542 domain-containing protein [Corynebacterium lubricantis]